MNPDEINRLRHMRDAATAAVTFAAGKSRSHLESDLMVQFAIVRALEIIGEAAASLPEETRATHSSIPWSNMIGMRNRLIHGYFDVDLDIIWSTVTYHLPPLIAALDRLIPATSPQPTTRP